MKRIKHTFVFCFLALLIIGCVDEKKENARKAAENYRRFIDSLYLVELDKAISNWSKIEADYNTRKFRALSFIEELKADDEVLNNDINETTLKFENYKIRLDKRRYQNKLIQQHKFRTSLFGRSYSKLDKKFKWINKNNILEVYQNFIDTVIENKAKYTIEDWKEIRLLYEAMDIRKNTVEKEGLTNSDNQKIADLKLIFEPIYKVNTSGLKFQ
jgi:hypothetical protein